MAWCRQATSHYLNQCWPGSMSPNGVTRPQLGPNSTHYQTLTFIQWPDIQQMCQISFKFCRDMDDSASLEDMSFEQSMTERQERGSLTSVNTNASSCTTDSNGSFTNLRVSRIFHFLFLIYICIDIWQDMISYCISLYKNRNVWFIYFILFFWELRQKCYISAQQDSIQIEEFLAWLWVDSSRWSVTQWNSFSLHSHSQSFYRLCHWDFY